MKKLLFVVIATVMVSGLLLGSMGSDAFALNQQGKDNGEARGCDNAKNEKIKEKNPHCEVVDPCTEPLTWYFDFDDDGYGTSIDPVESCTKPAGKYVLVDGDCDDGNPEIYPGYGCS